MKRILLYIILIIVFPFIILCMDKYNVFSLLFPNMLGDRWFNFLTDYLICIAGSFISGMILLNITKKQIDEEKKSNFNIKVLENKPYFNYDINTLFRTGNFVFINNMKTKNTKKYFISIQFENIGLNHAINTLVNIYLNNQYIYSVDFSNFGVIMKNNSKAIFNFIIDLEYFKTKVKNNVNLLMFEVLYIDLFNNVYSQKIFCDTKTTLDKQEDYYMLEIEKQYILDPEYIGIKNNSMEDVILYDSDNNIIS